MIAELTVVAVIQISFPERQRVGSDVLLAACRFLRFLAVSVEFGWHRVGKFEAGWIRMLRKPYHLPVDINMPHHVHLHAKLAFSDLKLEFL